MTAVQLLALKAWLHLAGPALPTIPTTVFQLLGG